MGTLPGAAPSRKASTSPLRNRSVPPARRLAGARWPRSTALWTPAVDLYRQTSATSAVVMYAGQRAEGSVFTGRRARTWRARAWRFTATPRTDTRGATSGTGTRRRSTIPRRSGRSVRPSAAAPSETERTPFRGTTTSRAAVATAHGERRGPRGAPCGKGASPWTPSPRLLEPDLRLQSADLVLEHLERLGPALAVTAEVPLPCPSLPEAPGGAGHRAEGPRARTTAALARYVPRRVRQGQGFVEGEVSHGSPPRRPRAPGSSAGRCPRQ